MNSVMTRINPGYTMAKGLQGRVCLYQGYGDNRRLIEWFWATNMESDWVCPKTRNGFWYGFETDEPR